MRFYALFALFVVAILIAAALRLNKAEVSVVVPQADPSRADAADTGVGATQQVMIHFEVVEISRSKLCSLGLELDPLDVRIRSLQFDEQAATEHVVELRRELIALNDRRKLTEVLLSHQLAKVCCEPTLVTTFGRPAHFQVGQVVENRDEAHSGKHPNDATFFGTKIDCEATLSDDGKIALDGHMTADRLTFDTKFSLQSGETGMVRQPFTRIDMVMRRGPSQMKPEEHDLEAVMFVTPEFIATSPPSKSANRR